jgi:AraC-like DNA-binding protein
VALRFPETTPVRTVNAILAGFAALGLDVGKMCASAGVERAVLADPERYLDVMAILGLWQAAEDQWGRPALGLHAGASIPFGALEVVDYLVASCATIGEALERLVRYIGLLDSVLGFALERHGADVTLLLTAPVAPPPPLVEFAIASQVVRFRRHGTDGFKPRVVRFRHACAGDAEAYPRILGCPVRFEAGIDAVDIGAEVLALPCDRRDERLGAILRRHADELMKRPGEDAIREQVGGAIVAELGGGDSGIERVAKRLGMSRRTLQRRLDEEGVSFAEMVEGIREGLARHYLARSDLAIAEIAFLLGYGSAAAFQRAFKRWTQTTPNHFRSASRG